MEQIARYRGCLLGLACGDAVGTTVEFRARGTFSPLTAMHGGGPFNLKPGEWTDDTSMALCLAHSLLEKEAFDPTDQMQRYVRWANEGYLSSTGRCFDIGTTVSRALNKFKETGDPFSGPSEPGAAGNGSIMRLAPVPMMYVKDMHKVLEFCAKSSKTTHGAAECIEASRLFGCMLSKALRGFSKETILFSDWPKKLFTANPSSKIKDIWLGSYREKSSGEIKGSGYVVQSLEAALWSFHKSNSFEEAVLCAVNLGDDADTTGAICGQIAGAYYGDEQIPKMWRDKLSLAALITNLAERLFLVSQNQSSSSESVLRTMLNFAKKLSQ